VERPGDGGRAGRWDAQDRVSGVGLVSQASGDARMRARTWVGWTVGSR
jgi:hypothetical protein